MSGPARGRRRRVKVLRALLPCLALIVCGGTLAQAQTLTPDLFRPVPDGFVLPQDSPLRRTTGNPGNRIGDNIDNSGDPAGGDSLRDKDRPAPSRIGQTPKYGLEP